MTTPPYALFIIAEAIEIDDINDSLMRAGQGFEERGWELWLASDSYEDAPKYPNENRLAEGTRAPVTTFTSPWTGKTLNECGHWLRGAGDSDALNQRYFTALDRYSRQDDTILLCRMMEVEDPPGTMVLQYFPIEAESAVQIIFTASAYRFDEYLQGYQYQQMAHGKPDRSKGEPFKEQYVLEGSS